jgi:preprotein translocase subunit SecE
MDVAAKGNQGNQPMADDEQPGKDERQEQKRPVLNYRGPTAGGRLAAWLRVYKPGQGYWTRLGTALAAAAVVLILARYVYTQLNVYTSLDERLNPATGGVEKIFPTWKLLIVGSLVILASALGWHYINKPQVADFLIATESEMKKVNWTTWPDLIGSTKVVIFFMFLIAACLFVIDIMFGYFFYMISVLKHSPF